jgi:hypothetical protein
VDRDFREGGKGSLGAKTGPNGIDLVSRGEMEGSGDLGHQPAMAGAAGFLHPVWMGGLANESGMGLL